MEQPQNFNGDIGELSAMMRRSWAANKQEPLLYTEPFLQSFLHQPGAAAELCPAIYDKEALVAFAAAFPRRILDAGKSWSIPVVSFLTVALEYQQWGGLGAIVWRGLADAAKRHNADGMISYCVEGDLMDQSFLKIARYCRLPTVKALTVHYLARPVPKGRGPAGKADPDILLRCAESLVRRLDFGREWTGEEARWQCIERDGAFGCAMQNGSSEGTISASVMLTGGAQPIRCGLVDDILWDGLEEADKKKLVDQLLNSASAAEVDLLLVPILNYTDMTPFSSAGFRKTKRALNMYVTAWNPDFPLQELSAAYVDVF